MSATKVIFAMALDEYKYRENVRQVIIVNVDHVFLRLITEHTEDSVREDIIAKKEQLVLSLAVVVTMPIPPDCQHARFVRRGRIAQEQPPHHRCVLKVTIAS